MKSISHKVLALYKPLNLLYGFDGTTSKSIQNYFSNLPLWQCYFIIHNNTTIISLIFIVELYKYDLQESLCFCTKLLFVTILTFKSSLKGINRKNESLLQAVIIQLGPPFLYPRENFSYI